MSTQHNQIDAFAKLLSSWEEAYGLLDCSYLTIKTPDGPKLLFGRILLEPSNVPDSKLQFKFESEHVIAGREIKAISPGDIQTALDQAKKGEMTISDFTCQLPPNQGNPFHLGFFPIYHPLINAGPRFPAIIIRGGSKHELLSMPDFKTPDMFDWELKCASQPFDTLDELLIHLGLPNSSQMGDSVTLEIAARPPASIMDTSEITNREASIKCKVAGGLDIQKINFGLKILRKNLTERSAVAGSSFEWKIEGDFQIGSIKLQIGEATLLQAFLNYNNVALHQWWVFDPQKRMNPRHAIHQVFDPELEVIKERLFKPADDKSRIFEDGVALLFNVLGFSVSHHGKIPKIQKGPDIIAFTPAGHIAVIECTTGLLNQNDKLAKLVQRAKLIKERIVTAGYGHLLVQPVIISSLPKEEVQVHFEEAGKNSIAVVCKENLENLFARVILPPDPDGIFREAAQLIPGIGEP
ncbi:MAG: hypothetical protein MCM46_15510 [Candidatus Manganitrophus sp. SB1]|nr:hypothetical protein [Candidatus Manganitrophus morganii]